LSKALPRSRAQLENWINHYAEEASPLLKLRESPPPLRSDPSTEPAQVPSREELRERFRTSLEKIEESDAVFEQVSGQSFFYRHHPLEDPFESPYPPSWFSGLVNRLCCLVFDAGEPKFASLCRFAYDPATGDIVASPSGFIKTLRSLRTSLQHGLRTGNKRNEEILSHVRNWYLKSTHGRAPCPIHARRLTDCLLAEWEELVERLHRVTHRFSSAASAHVVLSQIERDAGGISRGEFLQLAEEMIERIYPTLDL